MQIGEHKLVDKGSHTIIHKGKTVIHKTFLQKWWVGVVGRIARNRRVLWSDEGRGMGRQTGDDLMHSE